MTTVGFFAQPMRQLGSVLPPPTVVAGADHVHQAIERVARGEVMDYAMRAVVAHLHPVGPRRSWPS